MCEFCYVYNECSLCGKDSFEVDLTYIQDEFNSMLSGETIGYWHCKDCDDN
jgi:hypothetical protein